MAEANLNSHQSIDLTSLWEMLPDDPSPQIIEKLLDETSVELNQKNIEMNSKLLSQQTAMGFLFLLFFCFLPSSHNYYQNKTFIILHLLLSSPNIEQLS